MSVDPALALRVLAHELRSPAGVGQGYVRMLLEGRLSGPADERHAIEQIRDVLDRVGQLSRQASEAVGWLERPESVTHERVDARGLVDHALAAARCAHDLDGACDVEPDEAAVSTSDRSALSAAIASWLAATARERPGQRTTVQVRTRTGDGDRAVLEILAGSPDRLAALTAGPEAPHATAVLVERGGLGLALVTAALVLNVHGARTWTMDGDRGACGIRIPLAS